MVTFGGRHDHHYHLWVDEKTLFEKLDKIIEAIKAKNNEKEIEALINKIDAIREQLKKTV